MKHLQRNHTVAALVTAGGILALGASLGIAWIAGFGEAAARLAHPNWVWIPVALAGEIVAYLGYILGYRVLARAEQGAELELPHAVALVSTGFGIFVAAGGFALDTTALRRAGLSHDEARTRVLGLGALEYVLLAPAATVAALLVLLHHPEVGLGLTLPWLLGPPLGLVLALVALRFRNRVEGRSGWRRQATRVFDALELVKAMAMQPRRYIGAFAGVALYWIGDIFCLWAALNAFSAQTPPLAQLTLGYATGYALTRRTLPLGGAGVVEALLPLSLGWVGIALAPALLAVVAYRVINLWLPIVPALAGLPTLRRLETPGRRRRARAKAA